MTKKNGFIVTGCIDPACLPDIDLTEIEISTRAVEKARNEPGDRAELVTGMPRVLRNPLAVFESVSTTNGRQQCDGWIFVGDPAGFLVHANGANITKTLPAGRHLVVWVDKERIAYKWCSHRAFVTDEGDVMFLPAGFGRRLLPAEVVL